MISRSEKILRQQQYHEESYITSIGCWPLHQNNQVVHKIFVPTHNFIAKGGLTLVKESPEDSVLHLTGLENATLKDVNLSTVATSVESHTQFSSVQKEISHLAIPELLSKQNTQGSSTHQNKSIVTPVKSSI